MLPTAAAEAGVPQPTPTATAPTTTEPMTTAPMTSERPTSAATTSSPPAGTAGAEADLKGRLRAVIARALGLPSPDLLHPRVGFREHGMDSLLAVEALDQLERLLGRSLPDSLLHDHPDLERLVAHLQATAPDRPQA